MLPINTILHPTDFSDNSDYAFRLACSLARDYGARLIALHVTPPPVVVYGEGILPAEPGRLREAANEQLHRLQVPGSNVRAVARGAAGGGSSSRPRSRRSCASSRAPCAAGRPPGSSSTSATARSRRSSVASWRCTRPVPSSAAACSCSATTT